MELEFNFKLFGDKITVAFFATPIYNQDGTRSKDNEVIDRKIYYVGGGDKQSPWICGHTFLGIDYVLVEPFLPDTISKQTLEVLYKAIEHEFLHAVFYMIGEIIASVHFDHTQFVDEVVDFVGKNIKEYWSVNKNENPKENPASAG